MHTAPGVDPVAAIRTASARLKEDCGRTMLFEDLKTLVPHDSNGTD
jgi:hypothetical protein